MAVATPATGSVNATGAKARLDVFPRLWPGAVCSDGGACLRRLPQRPGNPPRSKLPDRQCWVQSRGAAHRFRHAARYRHRHVPGHCARNRSDGKRVVRGTTTGAWPPPPKVGEAVFFGGFPGVERVPITPNEISFGLHGAMVPLTDFTDYQLCARMERQYRVDIRGLGPPARRSMISAGCRAGRCFSRFTGMAFGAGVWWVSFPKRSQWRISSALPPCGHTISCRMGV